MKTKITLLAFITLLATKKATAQHFNDSEERYFSTWVDPTFTDKGEQFGVSFTMASKNGMFSEYSISHYSALEPSYTDLVVTWGGLLEIGKLNVLAGIRFGLIYREAFRDNEDNKKFRLYGLGGVMTRFQFPLYDDKLFVGVQFHLDARMDLSNNFVRENSSFYISYKLK